MLKFIKENMTTIDGIEIFPIISLLLFSTFFTFLIIWVIRTKKEHINEMKQYPLNDNDSDL